MVVVDSAAARRWFLHGAWVVVCAGLGLQVWATIGTVVGQGRPAWEAAGVLLSYFTVLTNLLAAAALTVEVTGRARRQRWWVSAESAVAMYIAVVGAVFHLLLREYVQVAGAQRIASEWLHYVNPMLYVVWWLLFVEKGRLRWRDAVWWLAYPAGYVAASLLRGAFTGFYPYWFVDVSALGYAGVAVNALGLSVVFVVLGFAVVWVDGVIARRSRAAIRFDA